VGLGKPESEQSYLNFINKTLQKIENLLKLLGMPNDKFQESIKTFFEDASSQDIEKLYILKGCKIAK
jgi:hypothetical protein